MTMWAASSTPPRRAASRFRMFERRLAESGIVAGGIHRASTMVRWSSPYGVKPFLSLS
jgi:hypothetical protein